MTSPAIHRCGAFSQRLDPARVAVDARAEQIFLPAARVTMMTFVLITQLRATFHYPEVPVRL